jgi:hypothetical protein
MSLLAKAAVPLNRAARNNKGAESVTFKNCLDWYAKNNMALENEDELLLMRWKNDYHAEALWSEFAARTGCHGPDDAINAAISCLGAFRRHRRRSKTCTGADITAASVPLLDCCPTRSLQIEKSLDRFHCPRRIFLLRCMTDIVEDHQHAARNIAVEAFGILGGNEAITPTPQDEGRQS